MPIFISYSHHDKDFVDRLAIQLVREKVRIWLDRWELHVGDSLITRIQEAISGASALLVILSKASVASEWCKKELSSGLIRELEEKRVVVLPVLLEKCDIPLFLRDKLYADFQSNFDEGFQTILESVARVTNEWQSRLETPDWHIDWAIDWGEQANLIRIRLTLVEQAIDQPYSSLSIIEMQGDRTASRWYWDLEKQEKGEEARHHVITALANAINSGLDLTMILDDQFEKTRLIPVMLGTKGTFITQISARRLGEDTGRNIVLHLGQQICQINEYIKQVSSRPS